MTINSLKSPALKQKTTIQKFLLIVPNRIRNALNANDLDSRYHIIQKSSNRQNQASFLNTRYQKHPNLIITRPGPSSRRHSKNLLLLNPPNSPTLKKQNLQIHILNVHCIIQSSPFNSRDFSRQSSKLILNVDS